FDVNCYEFRFQPKEPGIYKVNVLAGGEHIGEIPLRIEASDEAPSVEVLDKDLTHVPLSGSQIDRGIYGYSCFPKFSPGRK
ncbi:hypothetical protein COOONC_25639, partial [Cooperia oncophora]